MLYFRTRARSFALGAKPRSLSCSAGVRFLSALKGGVSTEEPDERDSRAADRAQARRAFQRAVGAAPDGQRHRVQQRAAGHADARASNAQYLWIGLGLDVKGVPSRGRFHVV